MGFPSLRGYSEDLKYTLKGQTLGDKDPQPQVLLVTLEILGFLNRSGDFQPHILILGAEFTI